ncbi:MAG: NUDIX hydrolase [Clostridia bacterium]|nr:NUDIX hydrolase [Clostridia bacterium]
MNEQNLVEKYIDGKVVFDGKIIRLEHWNVELPNGRIALREVACHPGASAVVALDEEESIILVHQYRAPMHRVTLEIPAGKLDSADEDPFECAKRELSEETGFVADHWEKLTVLETTPGFCNERIHLYLATGLRPGETHPDEDEFVATTRMPLKEAAARVMDGTFRDGKTALGIMMAFTKMNALAHKND